MSDKIWKRVWNALASATITQINDTGPVMLAQVKLGYLETNDNVPVVQQFGFDSVPPLQSDAVALFIGGDRSNGVIVGTNNQAARTRNKKIGESVVYNNFGISIYLTTAGLVINGGGFPVVINNCPTVTQNGDLHVTGEIIRGFGTGDQVTLGQHEHTSGESGSATSVPTPGH
jgi:phage gp45-like